MKYRKLGASDLEVSEISLGSWLTYGVGVARGNAVACVDRAFDLGINFIDTANVYGRGAAETFLGEVLASRPRQSYILATKVYFPMSATDSGLSRAQIAKQIDASLKRLRVDHVDLYQCHRYDSGTPIEETMQALSDVVRQGKARYIGFSEWSPQQIESAFAIAGAERFVSSQPQYSLLWRKPEEKVIPLLRRKRDLADRLVAAGARRAVGQISCRCGTAGRIARQPRDDGPAHPILAEPRDPRGGAEAEAARPAGGLHAGAVRAGLGAARAQCGLGHRGRQPARAASRRMPPRRAWSSIPASSGKPRRSQPAWHAAFSARRGWARSRAKRKKALCYGDGATVG